MQGMAVVIMKNTKFWNYPYNYPVISTVKDVHGVYGRPLAHGFLRLCAKENLKKVLEYGTK
ncbi:hypothetical protein HMI54_011677 [Coelomomyces lativittatus]|nr:hypothetical protein HMI54_011677 [Coelomomyces lativittatus]